jgi:hypothetical protein
MSNYQVSVDQPCHKLKWLTATRTPEFGRSVCFTTSKKSKRSETIFPFVVPVPEMWVDCTLGQNVF